MDQGFCIRKTISRELDFFFFVFTKNRVLSRDTVDNRNRFEFLTFNWTILIQLGTLYTAIYETIHNKYRKVTNVVLRERNCVV